ncbi:hypothetical protein H1R20_g2297, partial [Candolleomyces eurysporus]
MDSNTPAVFSDDDEYDLISNPGHDYSLESSVAGLPSRLEAKDIPEPPPAQGARDKLETVNWSADEIQARVRKSLNLAPETHSRRTVRIYVDGAFDVFNVGRALQLRQAKLAFPFVHLIVGVFPDELLNQHGCSVTWPEMERVEMVRHCRWVDEVITDIPWQVSEEFLLQRRVDYVAIDEGTSVDPNCHKLRVKGYDEIKRIGKVIQTKRTKGLSATRVPMSGPPTPVMATTSRLAVSCPLPTSQLADNDETPEPKFDIFGIAS